jgi:beta-phosphoglucomutase
VQREVIIKTMLKALIFDCDGVIADTEPLHMAAFQRVLAEFGVALTTAEYYDQYLAYDDRGCFEKVFENKGLPAAAGQIADLIALKARYLEPVMQERLRVFPGVVNFVESAGAKYPLAVASGALRREVELILNCAGIIDSFATIVAAEDVARGKPNPDPFIEAQARLNALGSGMITANECLVIEDSIHGVKAARAANMKCLAVTNSYPEQLLDEADLVVPTLERLTLQEVEALFNPD